MYIIVRESWSSIVCEKVAIVRRIFSAALERIGNDSFMVRSVDASNRVYNIPFSK